MCPPAESSSPAEIVQFLNDEQIFLWLEGYTRGLPLPNNVLADMRPFEHHPSSLPEGIWYLVDAKEKKESDFGFWKDKEEACKVYSGSSISGWRAICEYFEGQAPHGQRTDWLMYEHVITPKNLCSINKRKDSRSLCKIFHCRTSISKSESHSFKDSKTVFGSNAINAVASIIPNTNSNSMPDSKNESGAKTECDVEFPRLSASKSKFSPEDFSELECFSRGDYLELNDLQDDPESNVSSSLNSSCPSKLSEEYFDSLGLLQDLEDEKDSTKKKGNRPSSVYNFTSSVRSDDEIIQPPSSGSTPSRAGSTSVNEQVTDKRGLENTTKRHIGTRNEGPSNFSDSSSSPSTSHTNSSSDGEKKTSLSRRSGRMKRLKQYFCFKPQ